MTVYNDYHFIVMNTVHGHLLDSFHHFFIFQNYLRYFWSFAFPYIFSNFFNIYKKSLIDFDRNFIKHNLGRFDIFVEFSDPNRSPFIAPLILIFDFFYRYFVFSAY